MSGLHALLIYGIYPLWLAAGGVDYACHRRSHIELTSGVQESRLHLAQFACIVALLVLIALFKAQGLVLVLLSAVVIVHTLLSYIDVSYTLPRRDISVLEQHAHGFLNVLPLVAVGLIAVSDASAAAPTAVAREPGLRPTQFGLLLLSLLLLGGVPLLEEWLRSVRSASSKRA